MSDPISGSIISIEDSEYIIDFIYSQPDFSCPCNGHGSPVSSAWYHEAQTEVRHNKLILS